MDNTTTANAAALASRILMSLIFILSGAHKIGAYAETTAYMNKMGAPGSLLPLVILTELGGGLLILVGWRTRAVALLLAGFSIVAGVLFHLAVGDTANTVHFLKNLAIAGGFLAIVAAGPGAWSIDGRRSARA